MWQFILILLEETMKKILLATLISGAMSASALAVDAGSGTVTFTGAIIEAPCSIAPGDENQTVALGQVSNVTLQNDGASSAQPFSIKLEGCSLNANTGAVDGEGKPIKYNNTVSITFNGTEAVNSGKNTGFLQITGDAQGAAVKIMNMSGETVKVNNLNTRNFVAGDNQFFNRGVIRLNTIVEGFDL